MTSTFGRTFDMATNKCVFHIEDLPYAKRDPFPQRTVRLVASPETTGPGSLTITYVHVPPMGISNGHIHDKSDEYILFLNDGKVILDDEEVLIKQNSVVLAKKGVWHECVNTSDTCSLILYCVYMPALEPFGVFHELIQKTNLYLSGKNI
jgi:mannose-6-phosphate isomerase-like protein (cupin superfamily)